MNQLQAPGTLETEPRQPNGRSIRHAELNLAVDLQRVRT